MNAAFPPAAGTGNVAVTTRSDCSWTAASNATWIHVTSGASGQGNGTVSYTVDANAGPNRTGTVLIAGQTFTVMQGSCVYSIDPKSDGDVTDSEQTGLVLINATAGCSWTASPSTTDPWITIRPNSGVGNGSFTYSVTNNDGQFRQGTINVVGGSTTLIFDVNQNAGTVGLRPSVR
jgi:hypothetical protein